MQFLSLHLRAIAKMLPPNNGNIFTKINYEFLNLETINMSPLSGITLMHFSSQEIGILRYRIDL